MVPLAEQKRPTTLSDVVGQNHLTGEGTLFSRLMDEGAGTSLLFWGPPGTGKTTLAKIYAAKAGGELAQIRGSDASIAQVKKLINDRAHTPLFNKPLTLFIDEIHRLNKSQQDYLLPYVESGQLTLIGATTENPSFSLNNALLSRVQLFVLNPLNDEALLELISRHAKAPLTNAAKERLISMAGGDARALLGMLEHIQSQAELDAKDLDPFLAKRSSYYDKSGDFHYQLISALHKAVRGSDSDAALYWLARMLEGGEDRLYIARRLVRMAIEDIGLADPEALARCLEAKAAYEQLGSPEGELALAQATLYLALAPKSNRSYVAYKQAMDSANTTRTLPPPSHIINAPTKMMKELGFGKGYIYDPDTPEGVADQRYFPEKMKPESFYEPAERGFEREMKRRKAYFERIRHASEE
jgi:putative ATPase